VFHVENRILSVVRAWHEKVHRVCVRRRVDLSSVRFTASVVGIAMGVRTSCLSVMAAGMVSSNYITDLMAIESRSRDEVTRRVLEADRWQTN